LSIKYMPLLCQMKQNYGEKRDIFHVYRQLAVARAEQISGNANVIAEVEQLVKLESFFANCVFLHVNLEPLSLLLQMREAGFAHQANGHNPASDAHIYTGISQLLCGFLRILGQDLRDGMSEFVFCGIGPLAESLNAFQLLAPQFVNIFVEWQ